MSRAPIFPASKDPRQIGLYYEEYTKRELIKRGYGFLKHSFKAPPHEIDLIMTDGTDIVFVEVKARASKDNVKPEFAVDRQKMKNVFFAATKFIAQMKDMGIYPSAFGYRFDLAAIEHDEDGNVVDFRYHKDYYSVAEDELFRYADRYKNLTAQETQIT